MDGETNPPQFTLRLISGPARSAQITATGVEPIERWRVLLRRVMTHPADLRDSPRTARAATDALAEALALADRLSPVELADQVAEQLAVASGARAAARYLPTLQQDEFERRTGTERGWATAQHLLTQATDPTVSVDLPDSPATDPLAQRDAVLDLSPQPRPPALLTRSPVTPADALIPAHASSTSALAVPASDGLAPAEHERLARLAWVTGKVAALPALPPPDPTDRYSPRALTVLWLTQGDFSPHTTTAYLRDLTHWLSWAADHRLDPLTARPADLQAWLASRTTRPTTGNPTGRFSDRSHNRARAAVSSWYQYLILHERTTVNPALGVRSRTVGKTLRGVLDLATLKDFRTWYLARATDTAQQAEHQPGEQTRATAESAALDAAILDLMFFTGLRVSAVINAELTDRATVRGKSVLRFVRKGGVADEVVLVPTVLATLQRYWALRAARLGIPPDQLTGRLLTTAPSVYQWWHPGGAPLYRDFVFDRLRALATEAGVPGAEDITPHSTRATVATVLAAAGTPIDRIQDLLGHADIRTTRGYIQALHKIETSATSDLENLLTR